MTVLRVRGRDSELAALRDAHASVQAGRAACVLVEAAPGLGLTRILQEAAQLGRDEGFDVVWLAADELDQFAARSALLAALRDARDPGRAGTPEDLTDRPAWFLDRVADLLERRARRAPVSIVVDDAQWADPATLSVLRALPVRLADSRILWVLGIHSANMRPLAGRVRDHLEDNGALRLLLPPLSTEAVTRIAKDVLGHAPDTTLTPLLRDAHGNPFLVIELLRSLEKAGDLGQSAGGPAIPAGFRRGVLRRLGALPEDAMQLLRIGSVLGRRFDLTTAARMLGSRVGPLLPSVGAALDAGLLAADGDRLAFRHDLVRRAVYDELPQPVRSALHREAGEVLSTAGAPSAEVIRHVVLGGGPLDPEAMRTLREVVRDMGVTVPEAGADLALDAADRLPPNDPRRVELVTEAAYQLGGTRRVNEALMLVNAVLSEDLDPAHQAALRLVAAEIHQAIGDDTTAITHTRAALALPNLPDDLRTQLLKTQGSGLVAMGELAQAEEISSLLLEASRQSRETAVVVSALVFQSQLAFYHGRLSQALESAEQARRRSDAEPHSLRLRPPRIPALWLSTVLTATDRLDDAERSLHDGQGRAETLGLGWSLPYWHAHRACALLERGTLDDAVVEAEACLAVAEELDVMRAVPLARSVLTDVAVRQGDLSRARAHLQAARSMVSFEHPPYGPWLTLAEAALLDAENRCGEAAALTRRYGAGPQWLLAVPPGHWPRLVRFALRGRDDRTAQAVQQVLEHILGEDSSQAVTRAVHAHVRGLVERRPELLEEAVRLYQRGPRPLALAEAHEDLGNALGDGATLPAAITHLGEAQSLLQRCGAARDHDRVRRSMTRLGVRPSGGPRRSAATTGWDSLSESELRVVPLVAEGLTNRAIAERLFLSVHTVNTHLRHVFTKLGINSRVELTRFLLEREKGSADRGESPG